MGTCHSSVVAGHNETYSIVVPNTVQRMLVLGKHTFFNIMVTPTRTSEIFFRMEVVMGSLVATVLMSHRLMI